jgi:ferrochelatase
MREVQRDVVVCPCGFVSDHLEVLYDLDVVAADVARELGISFARTASLNDDPRFVRMLAGVVRRRAANS